LDRSCKEAEQVAREALVSAISNDTALRNNKISIFIYQPQRNNGECQAKGITLYPGFRLDHTAYARIASQRALEGNTLLLYFRCNLSVLTWWSLGRA
jgi:hypothetical protein